MARRFNTAGTCRPKEHYMVDITERVEIIRKMIAQGDYFCINRGRQYGKTTTLESISDRLSAEYCIFNISFETISENSFSDVESLYSSVLFLLAQSFEWVPLLGLDDEVAKMISDFSESHYEKCSEKDFVKFISTINHKNSKPIVLIIDEVDQAGNFISFIKFLGLLRGLYLKRTIVPTFQSVILSGVYDIKNLKLKIRPEDQHQYNSPWNIAVPFDYDMSLSAEGISNMLADYKADNQLDFDEVFIARLIREYTSGYPFLVSRICQIIDFEKWTWDKEGVLKAVNSLLNERNTLFDDMMKKLDEYPKLEETLRRLLFNGSVEFFSPDEKYIQIAAMFNFVKIIEGKVSIFCRIMETRLYNYFLAKENGSPVFIQGSIDKNQFVHDGIIDMPRLLERFAVHINQTFNMDKDHKFLEENGREIFLTYLRPIINGVGNYYIEAQTRDNDRMDVVIDYLGKQYVVELKIWRGDSYNERGEEQLCRYLEYFDLQTGYLLSFCFNRKKDSGLREPVVIGGRTLIEAVV